jgi:hypothetical protein
LSVFVAALAFAGEAGFAGCASASFGVSAKAVPTVRNSDSVSAAIFFIASLFGAKFDRVPSEIRTTPREKVKAASYSYVNRM